MIDDLGQIADSGRSVDRRVQGVGIRVRYAIPQPRDGLLHRPVSLTSQEPCLARPFPQAPQHAVERHRLRPAADPEPPPAVTGRELVDLLVAFCGQILALPGTGFDERDLALVEVHEPLPQGLFEDKQGAVIDDSEDVVAQHAVRVDGSELL